MFQSVSKNQSELPPFESLPNIEFRELHADFRTTLAHADSHAKYACRKMVGYVSISQGIPVESIQPSHILSQDVARAFVEYDKSKPRLIKYTRTVFKLLGQPDMAPMVLRRHQHIHSELTGWISVSGMNKSQEWTARSRCMKFLIWLCQTELAEYQPHTVPMVYLQRRHLVKYRQHLLSSVRRGKMGMESARGVLTVLIQWLKWLVESERIANIDLSHITIKHGDHRSRRIPNHTQLSKFSDALIQQRISDDYKLFFLLLLATGARPIEIRNLTMRDVDIESHAIFLNSKNGPGRWMPLPQHLWKLFWEKARKLHRCKDPMSAYILTGRTGQPLRLDGLQERYRNVKAETGVDVDGLMAFRHRFATDCYEKKVPVEVFQYLMGHRTLQEMKRYQHSNTAIQKNEIDNAFVEVNWVRDLSDW